MLGPLTSREIADLYLNGDHDAAGHKLKRMAARGKIKRVGFISTLGRPRLLYGTWHIRPDRAEHEYAVSLALLGYRMGEILRGSHVDQKYRPDAELQLKLHYMVELDRGTESITFVQRKRMPLYQSYDGIVLWIAETEVRREALRHVAAAVQEISLFGTLSDIQKDPFGPIFLAYDGSRKAIE